MNSSDPDNRWYEPLKRALIDELKTYAMVAVFLAVFAAFFVSLPFIGIHDQYRRILVPVTLLLVYMAMAERRQRKRRGHDEPWDLIEKLLFFSVVFCAILFIFASFSEVTTR